MVSSPSNHARRRSRRGEPSPIGRQIERGDNPPEHLQAGRTATEGMRATGRPSTDYLGCRFPAFRDSLDGLPPLPVHPDLDRPNSTEEVRLIGTGPHDIECLNAGRNRLGLCPT